MFSNNSYATIWSIEDKEKYSDGRITTSRKDQNGNYKTDFSGFVRFVGDAYEKSKDLSERSRIHILNCGVGNSYDKEKNVTYWNPIVFDFEHVESKTQAQANNSVEEDDDSPFGDGLPV